MASRWIFGPCIRWRARRVLGRGQPDPGRLRWSAPRRSVVGLLGRMAGKASDQRVATTCLLALLCVAFGCNPHEPARSGEPRHTGSEAAGVDPPEHCFNEAASPVVVTSRGRREPFELVSLEGTPEVVSPGDLVSVRGCPPIPVVGEGAVDYWRDPEAPKGVCYESRAGVTRPVSVDLTPASPYIVPRSVAPPPRPTASQLVTVRSFRGNVSDKPPSFAGFGALKLVELFPEPDHGQESLSDEEGSARLQAWVDALPETVEHLLIHEAAAVSLPPSLATRLVTLQLGLKPSSSRVLAGLPELPSLRSLRLVVHAEAGRRVRVPLPPDPLSERGLGAEPPAKSGLDLSTLRRFESLQSVTIEGETGDLGFVSKLPSLRYLELQRVDADLGPLVGHPSLERLDVSVGDDWTPPESPLHGLQRVVFRTSRRLLFRGLRLPEEEERAIRAIFPNARVLISRDDDLRHALRCGDEWRVRPRRIGPAPAGGRERRQPPSAILPRGVGRAQLGSTLLLGDYAPKKHVDLGAFPMLDIYDGGRLLVTLSFAECDRVYFVGHGTFEVGGADGAAMCAFLSEHGAPPPGV